MATPARPPERIIAPTLRSEGEDPAGVSAFLETSYAAKYLTEPPKCLIQARNKFSQALTLTQPLLDSPELKWHQCHERCSLHLLPDTSVSAHQPNPCIWSQNPLALRPRYRSSIWGQYHDRLIVPAVGLLHVQRVQSLERKGCLTGSLQLPLQQWIEVPMFY